MKTLQVCLFILLLAMPLLAISSLANAAEPSLVERISQTRKNLSATENRISRDKQKLAKKLNRLQNEVLNLREKTSVARRLADEKTLSLSKLEERLNGWREQQVYQKNLLHRFIQQHKPQSREASNKSSATKTTPSALISSALTVANNLELQFHPQWQPTDIVLSSGVVATLPTLTIGPITWYWDSTEKRAGFASTHKGSQNLLHADLLLSGADNNAMATLRDQSKGVIVFDPTLTRALAREQNAESLAEHIMKGGLWALPIIAFAIFALSICLYKAFQLWRLPRLVRLSPKTLLNVLDEPQSPLAKKISGMQQVLLDIAHDNDSPRQRDDQLFMQLQDDKHWLDRWISAIAITAAVSPLLGLLGTVSGMIETFKMMTLFGSGDPEVVSGGIAQALVTTELGLVVAIPALILNALLSRRAKAYYNELENFAILVSKTDDVEAASVPSIAVPSITTPSAPSPRPSPAKQEAIA